MNFIINQDSNFEYTFDSIAKELITNYRIKVNDKSFIILELEFYLYTNGHEDKCTHEHKLEGGQWRGHYSGIDITLRTNSGGYGGILIRGIMDELNKNIISGPLRVKNEILSNLGKVTEKSNLFLEKCNNSTLKICKSRRIGIKNYKEEEKKHYIDSFYRYIADYNNKEHKYPDRDWVNKNRKSVM